MTLRDGAVAVPGHVDLALLGTVLEAQLRIYDLGRALSAGMPQSSNHPEFRHTLVRRHGDIVRPDGGSASNDLIVMGTHVGTHIDALGHVSQDGALYGGADALAAQTGGRFVEHGIHTFRPTVCRGILLDVPAAIGDRTCTAGYEITSYDLSKAAAVQGVELRSGDAILVRTGWAQHWADSARYKGLESGVPGPGEDGARWLASQQPIAVGADTIAFEHLAPGAGHCILPAHRVLLVEFGINIIETLMLEDLAAARVYEFLLVLNPLNIVGATGSPLRPIAVVPIK